MVRSTSSKTVLIASLLLLASGLSAQIRWETDFDKALEKSKVENKLLFIAINMQGERANEEAIKVHYKDAKIIKLSKRCVNLFAAIKSGSRKGRRVPGLSHEQAMQIGRRVREKFLGIGPDQDVVAPQHLFVSPQGKILISVSHSITVGELEWMLVTGLQKMDPRFEWAESGRMRAPRRFRVGYAAPKEPAVKVPSRQEVEEVMRDLRKGRGAFRRNMDKASLILRSDDQEAIQFLGSAIKSRWVGGGRRLSILKEIGRVSPRSWYVVLEDYVGNRDAKVRDAAIVASGQLAESKLARVLRKQLAKEDDARIKGHLIRALVACSPKDRTAIRAIGKALGGGGSEELRTQAVVALSLLEDRKAVHKYVALALSDASGRVRSAAAYTIGVRREKDLRQALESVLSSEREEGAKKWMGAARACLEDGDGQVFGSFLGEVVGDKNGKKKGKKGKKGKNGKNGKKGKKGKKKKK